MNIDELNFIGSIQITWSQWVLTTLLVLGLFWIIHFANHTFEKASLLGGWKKSTYRIIKKIYIMTEPIALLLITASFIMINPISHGIMAIVLLLLSYTIVRSYFSGKVLQLNNELHIGQKIKVATSEGFIKEIGRTGLSLQTKQGAEKVAYIQLFEKGYTLLQGKRVGGIQALFIESKEEDNEISIQTIKDKLWESPYLDWSFDPEIALTNIQNQFEVKVLLRERNHLEDFKNLINEWGYTCRLKN